MNVAIFLAMDKLARKMAASAKAAQLELSPEDGSPEAAALALEEVQAREDNWERVSAWPAVVVLSMTGLDEEGNGREIRLEGAEAEKFLAALPVYEPIKGDS